MLGELKKTNASVNDKHEESPERLIRSEYSGYRTNISSRSLIQILLSHLVLLYLGACILAA